MKNPPGSARRCLYVVRAFAAALIEGSKNAADRPEIVVEILSPDDRQKDVDEKRRVYFAWGVTLELIADPDGRFVDVLDSEGRYERINASVESYSPAIIPSFTLPLRDMFAELDIPD